MSEVPDYEKYPISEEELSKRYKNWIDAMAGQMIRIYRVGYEVGGDRFIQRLKEEYYKQGKNMADKYLAATGTKLEDYTDCKILTKIQDTLDDSLANFWKGYRENTEKVLEKDLYTCPAAKVFSKEPAICDVFISEAMRGMYEALNPKFKFTGFSKLLPKGDKVCRIHVEMQE
jgi:hypothetical protein